MRARWKLAGGAALLAAVASFAASPYQQSPARQKPPAVAPARTATPAPAASGVSGWTEIDRLIDEQKLSEASQKVDALLRAAKARKDEAEWTKALIRAVQLRTGLHGYETAVRFLKDEPWPPGLLARATLDLFYAQALVHYAHAYSWEIDQRERVASTGPIDLKAWTRTQILGEAEKAYRDVWKNRAALGRLPVGALSEYVEPNNYPKDVRGTLRDAVSYLFVELLADSSFWTPEQSNGIYQLDVAKLLGSDGRDADARLADPAAHPLEKIAAILGDLETWHAGEGRREAELEARLERLRRLHGALSEEADRAAVRRDLELRLPRYRDVAWWAMGMAELAEFRQAESASDNLIRARQAALEGLRAYPTSVGGTRCTDLVASIEAPDYRVTSMSADAPRRRSIQVTHKNLPELYYRAYAVDLEKRLATATDYNLLPSGEEVRNLVRSGKPVAEWRAALPATPDYKHHRTFVTPPMEAPGLYVVVSSARADFAEKSNRVQSVALVLGNLVLVSRPENASVESRVVAGDTGRPVAGAEVWLYAYDWSQGRRHHRVASKASDAEGLVRFEYAPGRSERSYFLLARRGGDYALDPSYVSLTAPVPPTETTASLVYTDRSIYRPLQKILWKVVAYRGRQDLGRLATAPGATVTLTLRDANNEAIESRTVATNPFGSAAGEFGIPAGRALGGWRIESSLPGAAFIQVEEYKRPTFEVKWEDPKAPLRLNQPAALGGSARYYFGLPVASGQARWTVMRVPEYPWWWFWGRGGRQAGQLVAQGTSPLREDGSFEIRFTPAADERAGAGAKDIVYRYEANADVTDEGGETRSDQRVFRLGFVAVQADVRLETGFLREGVPGSLTVTRTDLDGVPRAGAGSWRLLAIREPEKTLLPAEMPPAPSPEEPAGEKFATHGDRLRPRWDTAFSVEQTLRSWPDGAEKAAGAVTHDAKGEARVPLPALPAGAWRLRYETRDEFGAIAGRDPGFPGRGPEDARAPSGRAARRAILGRGRTDGATAGFLGPPGPDGLPRDAARREGRLAANPHGRRGRPDRDPRQGERPRRIRRPSLARRGPPVPGADPGGLRPVVEQGAQDLVRHVPRQAAAGREGDLARQCPGAVGNLRRAEDGGAPGVHVRPEPGRVRPAQPAAAPGPVSQLDLAGVPAREPRRARGRVGLRERSRVEGLGGCPARRPSQVLRPLWCRRARPPEDGQGVLDESGRRRGGARDGDRPGRGRRPRFGGGGQVARPVSRGQERRAAAAAAAAVHDSPQRLLRDRVLEAAAPDRRRTVPRRSSSQVPDSVTSWNVWIHAVTRDFAAGSLTRKRRASRSSWCGPTCRASCAKETRRS